jgi:hypothetical protein
LKRFDLRDYVAEAAEQQPARKAGAKLAAETA